MYASSIGIAMVVSIFGSLYLGIWLDKKFGTHPCLTMLLLFLGVVSGFRNFYVMIRRSMEDDKADDAVDKGKHENNRDDILSKKN